MSHSKVFHNIIPAPKQPEMLPKNMHCLSGEGCGSWFHIESLNDKYVITRFSPEGKLECKGLFDQLEGMKIDMDDDFEVTYLSHCAEVNILQHAKNLTFKLKNKL